MKTLLIAVIVLVFLLVGPWPALAQTPPSYWADCNIVARIETTSGIEVSFRVEDPPYFGNGTAVLPKITPPHYPVGGPVDVSVGTDKMYCGVHRYFGVFFHSLTEAYTSCSVYSYIQ